jgi:Dolichyl-phosphate-mannose-protein mannosyltransferase
MIPSPKPAEPEEYERTVGLLLAAVLIVAFGVRLWLALVIPRFFDDHYVFNNITTFLEGSLRPRHSYYGSLSYLPQAVVLAICDWLHSRTGIGALAVHGTQVEGFSLGAFRIMRMFVIAYGLLSILMIYKVGRRLFSPAVGLIAAAVLAAYPQHVRSSIQLKPDMMALLFIIVTLYWTAGAARAPRLARFLLAGVGVGLATAAKYYGAAAALPLTVWSLGSGFRDRRRWGWLVLAGVTAVATFFVFNPFAGMIFRYVPKLVKFYGNRARGERSDHLVVLRRELDFLATQHGWILGAFLLLGIGLLVYRMWRKPESHEDPQSKIQNPKSKIIPIPERTAAVLSLSLCVGYPAAYAAGMSLFRTHNLLPAEAGTALVCAYAIAWCGQRVVQRFQSGSSPRVPAAAVVAGSLLLGLLLVRPVAYAYRQAVPNTWIAAEETLSERLQPLRFRYVALEPAAAKLRLSEGWQRPIVKAAPSLAALPPSELDLADAEVLPLSRTEGAEAAFYQGRRQRLAAADVVEVGTRPFRVRGTPLLLLLHPWTPAGNPLPIEVERSGDSPRTLVARLPGGLAAGDVLSLELMRPANEKPARLLLGGQRLPLEFAGRRRRRVRWLTPRFRYAAGTAEIRIPASPQADPEKFNLQLWRWTLNGSTEPRSQRSF